jgi:chromosome segregation ATPase
MVAPGQESKCTLITTGNVTVVPATRVPANSAKNTAPRPDAGVQRAKDSEARTILEAELRKAETQLASLQQEYKQGEPDRQGDETRNYQKYLDRKGELKAKVERTEADIASLRRELARMSPSLASTP